MTADYYATLGVAPTTEDVVIRAAYLALMRRYHPDTNASPAAAARARAITAAYEVLSDRDKRADYDRRRADQSGFSPPRPSLKQLPVGPIVFAVILLLLVPLLAMAIRSPRSLPQPMAVPSHPQSREKLASMRDPAASCASQATQDQIKRELFRQAAALHGRDPTAFEAIAAQSLVRVDSPVITEDRGETGAINCRASVAIDLPTGVAVAGGRTTLAGEIGYALKAGSVASGDAIILSNGDLIAKPLATLTQIARPADDLAGPPAVPDQSPAPIRPRLAEPPLIVSKPPPPPPVPRPQARADPKPAKPIAQPSCRFGNPGDAPTCSDSNLAALDRHVTLLYDQSLRYGDAAKRATLQRTHDRFLVRRDGCRSDSCLRATYLDRMREVTDIMTGQPQPTR